MIYFDMVYKKYLHPCISHLIAAVRTKLIIIFSAQSVDNPEMSLELRADRKVDGLPNAHEIAL